MIPLKKIKALLKKASFGTNSVTPSFTVPKLSEIRFKTPKNQPSKSKHWGSFKKNHNILRLLCVYGYGNKNHRLRMQNFTPEDLILFMYGELSAEMGKKVQQALENDWTLREKYAVLEGAGKRLDKLVTSPRQQTVEKILQYAANQLQPIEHS
jgi:hypothetical protein